MKNELKIILEILEILAEKESKTVSRLYECDRNSNFYHYEFGRLNTLREIKLTIKDLLDN